MEERLPASVVLLGALLCCSCGEQDKIDRALAECRVQYERACLALEREPVALVPDFSSGLPEDYEHDDMVVAGQRRFYESNPLGVDPGGSRYRYEIITSAELTFKAYLRVVSLGPDRERYTRDDIVYPH